LSPPIASSAMRITSVLDCHPLLAAVVAAGRTDAVRPLQVATPGARLERDVRRLVVRAAGTLFPFGGPSLRYGHGWSFSVARLARECGERVPARIPRRRARAGARVRLLPAARAQPEAAPRAGRPPPSAHTHGPGQGPPQSLEQGILRPELRRCIDRTAGQLSQVELQHRRAKLNPCGTCVKRARAVPAPGRKTPLPAPPSRGRLRRGSRFAPSTRRTVCARSRASLRPDRWRRSRPAAGRRRRRAGAPPPVPALRS